MDDQKAALLEKQILDLWDRVYQAWMMSSTEPSVGPTVTTGAVFDSWDNFMDGMQKTPGITTMLLSGLQQMFCSVTHMFIAGFLF